MQKSHSSFVKFNQSSGFIDIIGFFIGTAAFIAIGLVLIYLFAGGMPTIKYIFSFLLNLIPKKP